MKPPPFLTTRERELLPYLASGANRSQIADHFGLSEETVKRHTRNILTKFKAKTIRDVLWIYPSTLPISVIQCQCTTFMRIR